MLKRFNELCEKALIKWKPYYSVFKLNPNTNKLSDRENLDDLNELNEYFGKEKVQTIFLIKHEAGQDDKYGIYEYKGEWTKDGAYERIKDDEWIKKVQESNQEVFKK